MAKYKAKKKPGEATPQIRPGVPCLVIVVGAILVVMLVMFLVMRNA
jgi:hypothetical protein